MPDMRIHLLYCAFALSLGTITCLAQVTEGTISGTVTDSAGGVLAGAAVQIKNSGTGEARNLTTNNSGLYVADYLPLGDYEITASLKGFRPALVRGIHVTSNTIARADITLQIGTVQQTLEVTSATPPVDTEQGRIISTLNERQVEDLPLNGRQIYQLVLLEPGVTATLAPVISNTQYNTFNYGFSANGTTPRGNNYVLDGVTNDNQWLGGTPAVSPSVDAVQEFQVQTVNFSPEFGRNNGSVVTLVTKSGTNAFHGTLYDFVRNPVFDARNFFDTPATHTQFKQNDFGGSVGGPIWRDHTFFFFSYEGVRGTDAATTIQQGETPQFRALVAAERPNSLANALLQKFPSPPCLPGTEKDIGSIAPFISPAANWFLDGPPDGIPDLCETPYESRRPVTGDQYMMRLDHQFSERDHAFLRWGLDYRNSDVAREQLGSSEARGFRAPFSGNFPSALLGETHLFSAQLLNDFRFAFMREDFGIGFQSPGFAGNNFPTLFMDDGVAQFGGGIFVPRQFVFNTYTVHDSVAWTVGRHNIKFGFEVNRIQENSNYELNTLGYYEFNDLFTFANDDPYYASALVNPATGQFTSTPRHFRWWEIGPFVSDDWKVTRKLTLNLGLRYDLFTPPTEAQGILSNMIFPNNPDYATRIANARLGRVSQLTTTQTHNFAPRIGLAYDLFGDGSTALRASYAIAYLEPYSNLYTNSSRFDPPDSVSAFAFPYYYGGSINYGVPAIPSPGFQTGLTPAGSIPGTRISPYGVAPNLKMAYSEQWFGGIQHRFPHSLYASINYVSTAGHDLYVWNDINRFTGDRTSLAVAARRINPNWGSTYFVQNGAGSIYHGMNAQLQKQYSHGLMFTVNYTLGKSLDEVTDPGIGDYFNVWQALYTGTMDVANGRLDYGRSDFDVRHRVTANAIWDLPSPHAGFLRTIAGGWQLNGIVTLQSGRPFTVVCANTIVCDYNGDGNAYDRPNTPSFGNTLSGLSRSDYINGILQVSDFPIPVYGTDGNLGRNTFPGPGFAQTDASLFKNFAVRENVHLQFRWEVFNAFNRVNLYLPNSDLSLPFFGKSTQAFAPRQMQLSLKLLF